MDESIPNLRRDYARDVLHRADLDPDPIAQFKLWFAEAREAGFIDPNAMGLATIGADGVPHVRIVLLKGVGPDGFVFFTNYQSDKARDIEHNPQVALNFFWDKLERCVRITGTATKLSRAASKDYFSSRPRKSQIAAWASDQSQLITDRAALEKMYEMIDTQFEGKDVPLPANWGGYCVAPATIEFWQGRRDRLHDRLRYRRSDGDASTWVIERLSP